MDIGKDMKMRTLKPGTNGWTCVPDSPSPGLDPMCVDQNGMLWMDAWMNHKDPPAGKMALGYMLMGGSDESQTEPHAMELSLQAFDTARRGASTVRSLVT
jgi:hypothetical protein